MLLGNYMMLKRCTPTQAATIFRNRHGIPPKYIVYHPTVRLWSSSEAVPGVHILYQRTVGRDVCYVGPIPSMEAGPVRESAKEAQPC